jgi:Spy/CpxP family protein refolding chaperone
MNCMKSALFLAAAMMVASASAQDAAKAQTPANQNTPAAGDRPDRPQRGGLGGAGLQGLTEEQRTVVRTEMQAINEATASLRPKLREAQTALREAMFAEKMDEAAIRAKALEVGKVEGDIAVIRAQHYVKLKGKLPADAFEKLKNSPMALGGGGMGAGLGRGGEAGPRREGGDGQPGAGERPRRNRPETQ